MAELIVAVPLSTSVSVLAKFDNVIALASAFVLASYVLEPDEFNILFVTFKVCVPPVNV